MNKTGQAWSSNLERAAERIASGLCPIPHPGRRAPGVADEAKGVRERAMAGCNDQPFGPRGFRLLRPSRLQSTILGRSALSLDETRSGAAMAGQQRLARQRIWGAPGPANLAGAGEVLLSDSRPIPAPSGGYGSDCRNALPAHPSKLRPCFAAQKSYFVLSAAQASFSASRYCSLQGVQSLRP
jgi:hypothetical protein